MTLPDRTLYIFAGELFRKITADFESGDVAIDTRPLADGDPSCASQVIFEVSVFQNIILPVVSTLRIEGREEPAESMPAAAATGNRWPQNSLIIKAGSAMVTSAPVKYPTHKVRSSPKEWYIFISEVSRL